MKKLLLTVACATSMMLAFSQPCSDLFFSEYIEGTSNNKAIEIYNPTSGPINLNGYKVIKYFNGTSTPNDTLWLTGTLASGAVYKAVNPSADIALTSIADTLHTVTLYNGDDALFLYNGTTVIDAIGDQAGDPGINWPVGAGATSEYTLVRMASVQQGTNNWAVGATQWDVYPQNTFSYYGSHTMNACSTPTDTSVNFTSTSGTYSEGDVPGLGLYLTYAAGTTVSVDVVLKSGDPLDVNGYSTQTVNFGAAATTGSQSVTITDDVLIEGAEVLTFALRNPTPPLVLGPDSIFTLTINPSDQPFNPGLPFYTISQVRATNADGGPDSNTVLCGVGGRVYGINFRTAGLSFYINDMTAGMNVFSPASTFGYNVTEGDSVTVYGQVSVFRGLAQMAFLDTILVHSSGNPIPTPAVVTTLNETTEGELRRINGLTLVSPGQWNNNVNGFTVDATNGTTTFQIRIEKNSTAIPMAAPSGTFDVIGIGSQYATTTVAPYTDGYQLVPRKMEDVITSIGIEDEQGWDVSLYPNPTTGQLNIQSQDLNYQLQVIDLTGKTVLQKTLNANAMVDLSDLSNGIYLVKINSGTHQLTRKIILKK